jgi:hypothetical protein
MQDNTKTLIAAKTAVTCLKRITAIWEELDYYSRYNVLRPQNAPTVKRDIAEMELSELISFIWNINPMISKERNRLKLEKDAAKRKIIQTRLDALVEQRQQLIVIRDGKAV